MLKTNKNNSHRTSDIMTTENFDDLDREEKELLEKYLPNYELPLILSKKRKISQHLPPSLLPPTKYDFINCNLNEWK